MKVKMKYLDSQDLLELNQSSISTGRAQHINRDQLPAGLDKKYLINFHFEHNWKSGQDVRLSVILQPGVLTAWLDISRDEYAALPEVELSELEWEAAVCVGVPRWVT